MNIAKMMIPKVCIAFLYEDNTIRQGLEMITCHGYMALPVLDANQRYVGSITEGDFLRYMMKKGTTDKRALEDNPIRDILRWDFCPALSMESDDRTILTAILSQNFVPIVDGRNILCGILTRRSVISELTENI